MNGFIKLIEGSSKKKRKTQLSQKFDFQSSFDSGLGSDLSSIKDQTCSTENSSQLNPSEYLPSNVSTPASLRPKKKISFMEPFLFEHSKK